MIALAPIERRVTDLVGLVPRPTWPKELPEGLAELAERSGRTAQQIADRILTDDELVLALAEFLTVGETHFLRCPDHFGRLAEHVAARLGTSGRTEPVRIWSAGCATGEEVYSIAIAIASRLDPEQRRLVRVIGTDVNPEAIQTARRAVYRSWSFRGAPPAVIARFTDPTDGEGRSVQSALREHVSFRHASIQRQIDEEIPGSFDAILFRNVAIYLAPDALDAIYRGFAKLLRRDGLLFVSPSDPRPPAVLFATCADVTTSVYVHRCEAPGTPAAAAPLQAETVRKAPAARSAPRAAARPKPSPPRASRTSEPAAAPFVAADAVRAARGFADRGRCDEALALLAECLGREPDAAGAYALRGQVLLATGRAEDAAGDLRRAVYLAGQDPLVRFWYASALHASQRTLEARKQLAVVLDGLAGHPPESLLSDGETRARELALAAGFLKESLE